MPVLEFRLFGNRSIGFDGGRVRFAVPPRAQTLTALLLLKPGPHLRVTLASMFWPEATPEDARANLRRYLHQVTQALPKTGLPWIAADARTVSWNPQAPVWCDVTEFLRLTADASSRQAALELYTGDFFPESADEWCIGERERLRALFIQCCLDEAYEARKLRRFDEAASIAERALIADPWREDGLRLLMSVRYESGDRAGALAAYDRFEKQLHDELRVEPMAETTALRDAISNNEPLAIRSAGKETPLLTASAGTFAFVGRTDERATLRAAWERAARGAGSTAFVYGDAGIGKSRLVTELAMQCEREGARVIAGTTSPDGSYMFQPLLEALRPTLNAIVEADVEFVWLSTLARVFPELRALIPNLPEPPELDAAQARRRLIEAVVASIEALARRRPTLLVLEDVHWATNDIGEALATLARRAGGLALLVVVTYRAHELREGATLSDVRRVLQRERRALAVPLGELHGGEIASLVASAIGGANFANRARMEERVHRYSHGNPLFATQLIQSTLETGHLPDEAGAKLTLRDAIATRLHRLDESVRSVAEIASAIGPSFDAELIAAVAGLPEDRVLSAVAILVERSIVREAGFRNADFAFVHDLMSVVAYESMPQDVCQGRHYRIAAALERRTGDSVPLAEIARHWDAAGAAERGAHAYLAAAHAALHAYARDDASRYCERVLELTADGAIRFQAAMTGADALLGFGDNERRERLLSVLDELAPQLAPHDEFSARDARGSYDAQAAYPLRDRSVVDRLIALAESLDDDALRARAWDAAGAFSVASSALEQAFDDASKALAFAARTNDIRLTLSVRQHVLFFAIRLGRFEDVQRLLEQQRALAPQLDRLDDWLNLYGTEAAVAALTSNAAECERVGQAMLAIARQAGSLRKEALAHTLLAQAAHMGRFDAVTMREEYDSAFALFERLDDLPSMMATHVNRGWLERETGHVRLALEYYTRAESLPVADNSAAREAVISNNMLDAALELGDVEQALAQCERAVAAARKSGESRFIVDALRGAAAALAGSGDYAAALAACREALTVSQSTGSVGQDSVVCQLIEIYEAMGDHAEAQRAALPLAALVERAPETVHDLAYAQATLSRMAAARGDHEAALRYMRQAKSIFDSRVARLEVAEDRAAFCALRSSRSILELIAKGTQPA